MSATQRPQFEPSPCASKARADFSRGNWVPLVSCPANFPVEAFENAILQLIHHPEYNSTLILRSETLAEFGDSDTESFPECIPTLQNHRRLRCIHRKLLPRRPGRDPPLEQYCTLYTEEAEDIPTDAVTTLVLTPIVTPKSPLPYYHPTVIHLAFHYLRERAEGTLQIQVIPCTNTPLDPNARLYRTCLALLETLHRYGWGVTTNYQKRVIHDVLVPREEYQDLYLVMRERHKSLVDTWQEVTDPLKHVFEDIGIATYLILLWKRTFSSNTTIPEDISEPESWKKWPRPPGGFIDFGCGNGLLTHILTTEGYTGYGIDVRARTSWASYPQATQERLRVHAFDPVLVTSARTSTSEYFPQGVFIIANHADELTPWTPVLATLFSASGYLSIPCCAWTFDAKYARNGSNPPYPLPDSEEEEFIKRLNLGGDATNANTSSYSMYRIWLASLSVHCGWEVETEILRIPSTRNWAVIGRKAHVKVGKELAMENVNAILRIVQERGVFKPRKPEGKAGH